jgi:DNA replication protein DnaC
VACEICDDTTWKTITVEGVSRVTRCDCVRESAARRRFTAAGVPDKYKNCTLDNFDTHYDSLRAAARKASRFVDEFPAFPTVKRGLMFYGSFGVGKTHLAVAVLKGIISKGGTGYFAEVPSLLKRVRDSFDSREQDELDVLRPVLYSDVLLLDDLGEEKTSEWVQEALAHVVNVRYSENRATLFTTNLTDSPDSTHPRSFVHKVGGRTRSRLIEMCDWVEMEGSDTRETGPDPSPATIAKWQEKSPLSPQNVERARKGEFPERTRGQLKMKRKPRFGEGGGDLKWSGGKAGNQ